MVSDYCWEPQQQILKQQPIANILSSAAAVCVQVWQQGKPALLCGPAGKGTKSYWFPFFLLRMCVYTHTELLTYLCVVVAVLEFSYQDQHSDNHSFSLGQNGGCSPCAFFLISNGVVGMKELEMDFFFYSFIGLIERGCGRALLFMPCFVCNCHLLFFFPPQPADALSLMMNENTVF